MNKIRSGSPSNADSTEAKLLRRALKWGFVLIPALITSLVALIPFAFDYYKKWSGDLNYEIISGPYIRSTGEAKRVTSVIVRNSGTSKVSDVVFRLSLPQGKIDEYAIEDGSGLLSKRDLIDGSLLIAAPAMHPSEQFSLTFMSSFVDTAGNAEPIVHLRASELLGYERKTDPKGTAYLALLSASLAGLSVIAMGLAFSSRQSTLRSFARSVAFPGMRIPNEKRERLLFVSLIFQIPALRDIVLKGDVNTTYRECGTFLLAIGASQPPDKRERTILAMCALLLIDHLADVSRVSIEDGISALTSETVKHPSFDELNKKAQRLTEFEGYRRAVLDLAEG